MWSDLGGQLCCATLLFASSEFVDVVLLFFGVVAILIAIFGENFTVADGEASGFKRHKPMPTWLGKLIAGVVRTAFVLYAATSRLSR